MGWRVLGGSAPMRLWVGEQMQDHQPIMIPPSSVPTYRMVHLHGDATQPWHHQLPLASAEWL